MINHFNATHEVSVLKALDFVIKIYVVFEICDRNAFRCLSAFKKANMTSSEYMKSNTNH